MAHNSMVSYSFITTSPKHLIAYQSGDRAGGIARWTLATASSTRFSPLPWWLWSDPRKLLWHSAEQQLLRPTADVCLAGDEQPCCRLPVTPNEPLPPLGYGCAENSQQLQSKVKQIIIPDVVKLSSCSTLYHTTIRTIQPPTHNLNQPNSQPLIATHSHTNTHPASRQLNHARNECALRERNV